MLPRYNDRRVLAAIVIIIFILGLWMGIFLSLPAKSGYGYAEWKAAMDMVYKPMLRDNWYGLKNPMWWKPYINEFTARSVMLVEGVMICVVLYIIYFAGNYIHGKEFGTAKWANPYEVNKRLRDKNTPQDKIYVEKVKRRWLSF